MAKTKQQIKKEQANMQSDAKEMEGWGEGIVMGGLDSPDPTFTYTFDDVGQLDLFSEEEMRQKYPALNQAYEHYQSVLEICTTKEQGDNED